MKYLNIPFYLLILFFIFSCQNKETFQPIKSKSTADYLSKSKEYSKQREENERKYLQTWIDKQKDSLGIVYTPTSSGFWIRFIKNNETIKSQKNNTVVYSAEIQTLFGQTIYTSQEFGKKKGILGKFKDLRGIESALYLMRKGEVAELILPSFTAYGLYGDEKKIGGNVPLRVILTLEEVNP